MADADGIVEGSVAGLAHMASLSPELTRQALQVLTGPDPDSSDGTSGERVLTVPGGWFIINHASYRDRRTKQQEDTAERVRRHRERKRQEEGNEPKQDETRGNARKRAASSSSGSSSGKKSTGRQRAPKVPQPDDVPDPIWTDWLDHRRRQKASTSDTVIASLRAEGEKVGLRLADVMGMQVTNGWRGFQAAWVKRPRPQQPPGSYPNAPGGISSGALELAKKVDEERKRRLGD
jgi:hypothetical protein